MLLDSRTNVLCDAKHGPARYFFHDAKSAPSIYLLGDTKGGPLSFFFVTPKVVSFFYDTEGGPASDCSDVKSGPSTFLFDAQRGPSRIVF